MRVRSRSASSWEPEPGGSPGAWRLFRSVVAGGRPPSAVPRSLQGRLKVLRSPCWGVTSGSLPSAHCGPSMGLRVGRGEGVAALGKAPVGCVSGGGLRSSWTVLLSSGAEVHPKPPSLRADCSLRFSSPAQVHSRLCLSLSGLLVGNLQGPSFPPTLPTPCLGE